MSMTPKQVRCAIYTRKSSEEGLGQQFNSLEAQRAAGEAYIESRRAEGWVCLTDRYDDGGYSGGTMDRPGLKRLLADVEAGLIDVVIVYKLDRATRSLKDFARIMELLDRVRTALTAVTQPIDTSTAMGRMIVHVLMSFAQFERELGSERTRDKIAASRKRGIWTGGCPVLGYDYAGSKLIVNGSEAETVRRIYAGYIERPSLRHLLAKLAEEGVRSKRWTTRAGREVGGGPLTLTALSTMLSSPLYIGLVPHKQDVYPGQHEAIVDEAVYRRVQELLAENRVCGASMRQNKYGGLLKGILTCGGCGCPLVHTTTSKREGVLYRYYTCRGPVLASAKKCKTRSVPAEEIERFVVEKVRSRFAAPEIVGEVYERIRSAHDRRVRDARLVLECERAAHARAEAACDASKTSAHARRVRALESDLARLEREAPTRERVETGLTEFTGVWRSLSPSERTELVKRVVRRVRFDAASGSLTIETHESPTGEEAA